MFRVIRNDEILEFPITTEIKTIETFIGTKKYKLFGD